MREIVIVDAVRTPVGKRNGSLAKVHSNDLMAAPLKALIERTGIDPGSVEHVVGGCVGQVGMQASNVTRQAWLTAGFPLEVPAVTVNVQCGSSQQAMTMAHGMLAGGMVDIAIATGVESMSGIPMGSAVPTDGRLGGPREGHYAELYEPTTQFEGADRIAETWNISREELEVYGKRSQDLAAQAWAEDRFAGTIVPVEVPVFDENGVQTGTRMFERDECMRATTLEGLAGLRVNQPDRAGARHTAGTSSQISDGAAAVLLMTAERAAELGLTPRARLVQSVLVGSDPVLMLTGPMPATRALLKRSGLSLEDIDLFEVNEAFASVVLAWRKELDVDLTKVNPNGGAIALGHPLGGTGCILTTKALGELERTGGRYGLVSMCCGGGLGTGTILERI